MVTTHHPVPTSFREVVDLWPTVPALAADLVDLGGESPDRKDALMARIAKWRERDNIPPEWWELIIRAAEGRQFINVTSRRLTIIANGRRGERGKVS